MTRLHTEQTTERIVWKCTSCMFRWLTTSAIDGSPLTRFFLSINTAIFAVFGLSENAFTEWSWGLSLAGIVLCYSWCRLIRSYKDLNTAKFKVVHEMEKELPFTPFDAEWEAVGRGEKSELYLPFTEVEMKIPWVFAAIHVGAFLVATVPFLIEQFCKVSP